MLIDSKKSLEIEALYKKSFKYNTTLHQIKQNAYKRIEHEQNIMRNNNAIKSE